MEIHTKQNNRAIGEYVMPSPGVNGLDHLLKLFPIEFIMTAFEKMEIFKSFFHQTDMAAQDVVLTAPAGLAGKKSFLVFKCNKYFTVSTDSIAYFYVRYESTRIICFDRQEYSVSYSLEQIQHLLTETQFYRLNRQYLINFNAIKEVEHYFARKLLVNLAVPVAEKLLVSKEKVSNFLQWMENR